MLGSMKRCDRCEAVIVFISFVINVEGFGTIQISGGL